MLLRPVSPETFLDSGISLQACHMQSPPSSSQNICLPCVNPGRRGKRVTVGSLLVFTGKQVPALHWISLAVRNVTPWGRQVLNYNSRCWGSLTGEVLCLISVARLTEMLRRRPRPVQHCFLGRVCDLKAQCHLQLNSHKKVTTYACFSLPCCQVSGFHTGQGWPSLGSGAALGALVRPGPLRTPAGRPWAGSGAHRKAAAQAGEARGKRPPRHCP